MATTLTLDNIEKINGTAVSVRKGSNAWHVMTAAPVMIGSYTVRSLCARNVGNDGEVEMTTDPQGDKFCKACIRIHRALLDAASEEREAARENSGQLLAFRIEGEPVTGPSESERAELVTAERERRAKLHAARKYATTRKDVTPGFDRRAAEPVDGRCGVHYRRDGLGWIAYANSLPGAVSGKGKTIDLATDAMLAALRAEESGTDTREDSGKIWGLSWGELRAANAAHYATHPASPEVAALPDPHVKGAGWSGTDASDTGTVVACDFKGDVEIIDPEKIKGKCPECRAYIPLQDVESDPDANRIGKHNRYGVATPAGAGMSSRSIENVEHGTIAGDPAAADKRRIAESRCVKSNKLSRRKTGGTFPCPDKGCGRPVELIKKVTTVKGETVVKWIIPNHVRPGDSFRSAGGSAGYVKGERKVTPRGNGADTGATVERGKVSARLALSRGHGTVDGAANVGSQNMAPVRPGGWVGKAGTMSLPATVRPGIDPEVDTAKLECPVCKELPQIAHKGKSKSWKRNHSRRLRAYWEERDAERRARRDAAVAAGDVIPAGERKAARKAASVGSFAEGTVASTGTVTHGTRPAFTPKGERKAAPTIKHKRRSGRAE